MILSLSPCSQSKSQGVTSSSDYFVLRLSSGCFCLSPLLHCWWKHVNSEWQSFLHRIRELWSQTHDEFSPFSAGCLGREKSHFPEKWGSLCWKGALGHRGSVRERGSGEDPRKGRISSHELGALKVPWDLYLCVVVQFATPWTAACQASLPLTISWSLPKFMFVALVMPPSHLIFWHPSPSALNLSQNQGLFHWVICSHQMTKILYCLYIYLFILWPWHTTWEILVSQPGIEPQPPAWAVQSLNHWTTREVLKFVYFYQEFACLSCNYFLLTSRLFQTNEKLCLSLVGRGRRLSLLLKKQFKINVIIF